MKGTKTNKKGELRVFGKTKIVWLGLMSLCLAALLTVAAGLGSPRKAFGAESEIWIKSIWPALVELDPYTLKVKGEDSFWQITKSNTNPYGVYAWALSGKGSAEYPSLYFSHSIFNYETSNSKYGGSRVYEMDLDSGYASERGYLAYRAYGLAQSRKGYYSSYRNSVFRVGGGSITLPENIGGIDYVSANESGESVDLLLAIASNYYSHNVYQIALDDNGDPAGIYRTLTLNVGYASPLWPYKYTSVAFAKIHWDGQYRKVLYVCKDDGSYEPWDVLAIVDFNTGHVLKVMYATESGIALSQPITWPNGVTSGLLSWANPQGLEYIDGCLFMVCRYYWNKGPLNPPLVPGNISGFKFHDLNGDGDWSASEQMLFRDDFDDGVLDGWDPRRGNWVEQGGFLKQTDASAGPPDDPLIFYFLGEQYAELLYRAVMTPVSGDRAFALPFYVQDENDYVFFWVNGAEALIGVWRRVGDSFEVIEQRSFSGAGINFPVENGMTYGMRVDTNSTEGRIEFYFDEIENFGAPGELLIFSLDREIFDGDSGYLGLATNLSSVNFDWVQQAASGEPGLEGWEINLDGPVTKTTITDSDGSYTFPNLPPGTYTVWETLQDGWTETTGGPFTVELGEGESVTDINFGNKGRGTASISGFKFYDLNQDGLWSVSNHLLFQDDFDDGLLDGWDPRRGNWLEEGGFLKQTDASAGPPDDPLILYTTGEKYVALSYRAVMTPVNGDRAFALPFYVQDENDYVFFWVNGAEALIGVWRRVGDSFEVIEQRSFSGARINFSVENGMTYGMKVNTNFAEDRIEFYFDEIENFDQPGEMMVFSIDRGIFGCTSGYLGLATNLSAVNFDWVSNSAEPGLEGWEINLDGPATETVTTGPDGSYEFSNLPSGTYTVWETNRDGWMETTAGPFTVKIGEGESISCINFGNWTDRTTINHQIDAGIDDVYEYTYTRYGRLYSYYNSGRGYLYAGDYAGYHFASGLRWLDISIPRGAEILEAKLLINAYNTSRNSKGEVLLKISGIAEDSANPWSSSSRPSQRERTLWSVRWNAGAWQPQAWYESPDIRDVIQEIVDRPGWQAGNALALILEGDAGSTYVRYASSRENGAELGAKVIIRFRP